MSNGNGHSWSKFFWRDWQSEPALRLCDLAAQGFWMRMLCLMHEADKVGCLLVNGGRPGPKDLAMIFGCTEREAIKHLATLEKARVFSRTDDGTIYCRRMVKDAVASDGGRQWAEKRWKGQKPNGSPNGSPNGVGNGEPSRTPNGEPNAKNLEAEVRPPRSPPANGGVARRGYRNGFHELDRRDGGGGEVADFQEVRRRLAGGSDG